MRLTAVVVALLASGCAGTQTDATQPMDRACSVSECFLEREVRDFDVLDPTTLVVYIGAQRCAFKVEITGTFCDLTYAPEVFFRSRRDALDPTEPNVLGAPTIRNTGNLRVCSGDLTIAVDGGPITNNSAAIPTGNNPIQSAARSQCQLSTVSSLTDNQVLELYVAHDKVAPPPPMGGGQIEVGEQKDEGSTAPNAEGTSPPPAASPPGG